MQFGLGKLESRLGSSLVAGFDRALDLLDEGAHAALPRTVHDRALLRLAQPFLGGFVMRHLARSKTGRAGLYRCQGGASTAWPGVPERGRSKADCIACLPASWHSRCSPSQTPSTSIAA